MESGPDPGGQGLPLGIWAGLQEFFNILRNFQRIRRREIDPYTYPALRGRCTSHPGVVYTYPAGRGRCTGRFPGGGFFDNFAKY